MATCTAPVVTATVRRRTDAVIHRSLYNPFLYTYHAISLIQEATVSEKEKLKQSIHAFTEKRKDQLDRQLKDDTDYRLPSGERKQLASYKFTSTLNRPEQTTDALVDFCQWWAKDEIVSKTAVGNVEKNHVNADLSFTIRCVRSEWIWITLDRDGYDQFVMTVSGITKGDGLDKTEQLHDDLIHALIDDVRWFGIMEK